MMVTILLPSLSGAPVTVILSPAFNVLAFQPKPNSLCGEAVSATHFSTLPFSPITSKCICTCGLVNMYSVTVPDMVTGCFVSYCAPPWCANIGPETKRRTTPATKTASSLLFIFPPPNIQRIRSHPHSQQASCFSECPLYRKTNRKNTFIFRASRSSAYPYPKVHRRGPLPKVQTPAEANPEPFF